MIPNATYRLQFNSDFTFNDGTDLVPYLLELGVSHVYASPILKTRAGSNNGYDIIDHNTLNPDLGTEADFRQFTGSLQHHGMKLILDIVPNHMAIGGGDNRWWLDILEHGEASAYAGYFDIDWHPPSQFLNNKLLLPFLGDYYGNVLERGELTLQLVPDKGSFQVNYFDHVFPVDPMTYPIILGHPGLGPESPADGEEQHQLQALLDLEKVILTLRSLPRRSAISKARRLRRRETADTCKQQLARLYRNQPALLSRMKDIVATFNATGKQHQGRELLHRLLEKQAWRLAYWKVAADVINYRRFFDINELAGLRVDKPEVFDHVHRYLEQMIREGLINGVRVDHVDGLADPLGYCQRLQALIQRARTGEEKGKSSKDDTFYCVVEKILATDEELAPEWQVHGDTGYEFAALVNGLFIRPDAKQSMTELYEHFVTPKTINASLTGQQYLHAGSDISRLGYQTRKLIMQHTLAGELSVLANRLSRIAQADRSTRDFTYHSLRGALMEVIACFPVYRTYLGPDHGSDQDRCYLKQAIEEGGSRSLQERHLFDFIHRVMLQGVVGHPHKRLDRQCMSFCRGLQQYTPMVAAKGLEDTTCYRYHRLVSLNDVGFDLDQFATSVALFHDKNKRRLSTRPATMVSTSTHDSKRGEDVRARINVLSEIPSRWRYHVLYWQRINATKKTPVNGLLAPSDNDEYLLYQTLIGTWPLAAGDKSSPGKYKQRVSQYMIKACREAKVHTSWVNPDSEYEGALSAFVEALFSDKGKQGFLRDFRSLQARIIRPGLYNALAQTLLKLSVPGIPDIYQGNELWNFALVDPDNRRPVDFMHRQTLLRSLASTGSCMQEYMSCLEDGRAKMHVTRQALALQRRYPALFRRGEYLAMEIRGPRAGQLVAFARVCKGKTVIVVVARWTAALINAMPSWSASQGQWQKTYLILPSEAGNYSFRDVLCDEYIRPVQVDTEMQLAAGDVLQQAPLALLESLPEHHG